MRNIQHIELVSAAFHASSGVAEVPFAVANQTKKHPQSLIDGNSRVITPLPNKERILLER